MGYALLWYIPRTVTNVLLCVRHLAIHFIGTKTDKTIIEVSNLVQLTQLIILLHSNGN